MNEELVIQKQDRTGYYLGAEKIYFGGHPGQLKPHPELNIVSNIVLKKPTEKTGFFQGFIDDIRIYQRAIIKEEILINKSYSA